MSGDGDPRPVRLGFATEGVRLPIAALRPLHQTTPEIKRSARYRQIVSSIREVGLVEPPVVAPDPGEVGAYFLLDGHLRVEALKELGETAVVCLVSTDDEAYTYNRRINRLAIIQEHKMILKAIDRGVPEERLAKTLNLNIRTLRQKARLLDGICPEAAEMLKDKHVPIHAFQELRRMKPLRQIEAAHLMIAMDRYSIQYARFLVAATPPDQLVPVHRPRSAPRVSQKQVALLEREAMNVERAFKLVEQSYGVDCLDLVLAQSYLGTLLANPRLRAHLAARHSAILRELESIVAAERRAGRDHTPAPPS